MEKPKSLPKSRPKSLQILLAEEGRPVRILLERELPPGKPLGVILRSGEGHEELLGGEEYDTLLLDLELPVREGEAPLRMVRGSGGDAEVVVLSNGTPTPGRPAPDDEGYPFLTRPLDPAEMRRLAAEAPPASQAAPAAGPSRTRRRSHHPATGGILGSSPALARLLSLVERAAMGSAAVLLEGETGSGKGLVARALHDLSPRRHKPFVAVNCSAFQEQLLESELFGHEKGAFTGAVAAKPGLFEVADGGTLFLDEVAEMSPPMQAKLLQVLDDGQLRRVGGTRTRRVDVRIVSATNKSLDEELKAGRFREDLLFRLRVVHLQVPPLRERREDVAELVEHFLRRFQLPGEPPKRFSPAALRLLSEHSWPGNVRELANVVEGLVLLAPGEVIDVEDLPPGLRPARGFQLEEAETPLPMVAVEKLHIARTLRYTEGKKAPAARLLGIDVKTLNSKIRSYGIVV